MKFVRCERINETDSMLSYSVSFYEDEMREPLELAYRFLYKDAKIDIIGNDKPYEHLIEMLGENNVESYLVNFIQNYVASCVAENEGFFIYGIPQVSASSNNVSDEVKSFTIDYRKTPVYELSEYGPIRVTIPSGEIDEKIKVDRMLAVLRSRFQSEIKSDDLMPVLDEITKRFFRKLEIDGTTLEEYCKKHDINNEHLHMLLFNEAVDEFKENMALDAIYRHEKLQCDKKDELVVLAQIDPDQPDALKQHLKETCSSGLLRQAAQRQAARRWLMETAEYVIDDSLIKSGKKPSDEALDTIRQAIANLAENVSDR